MFAWGLNNHGQLGIGSKFNCSAPSRVKDLDPYEGDYVVEVAGGEHHSIARTKDGLVYCWGRNDEGQLGLGDTYGEWRKKRAAEEALRLDQEEKAKEAEAKAAVEVKPEAKPDTTEAELDTKPDEKAHSAKSSVKKHKAKVEKEEDLKYIYYFYRPQLVEDLWKWELAEGESAAQLRKPAQAVYAAGQYSYAICGDEVYSWGMGENYVLGNRDDCNQFKPYKLDPRMFEGHKVTMMGLGTQHAVAVASTTEVRAEPAEEEAKVTVAEPAKPVEEKPAETVTEPAEPEIKEPVVDAEPVSQEPTQVNGDAHKASPEIELQETSQIASSQLTDSKKRTYDEMAEEHGSQANLVEQGVKKLKIEGEPLSTEAIQH